MTSMVWLLLPMASMFDVGLALSIFSAFCFSIC